MKIFLTTFALMATCSLMATAVVPIDEADRVYDSDGGTTFVGQGTSRIGKTSQVDPIVSWAYTLPFALPEFPEGQVIESATLTVNLEGWVNFSGIGPIELYGINRVSPSSTVVFDTDFVDGTNPEANANAVKLQADFVPVSAISSDRTSKDQSSPHTSINIGDYIQSLYDQKGGKPGDYSFLTMAVDVDTVASTANHFYVISSANSTNTDWQPSLTIKTVWIPEPTTYGLLAGVAVLATIAGRRQKHP